MPPTTDDELVYWVRTAELAHANDRDAAGNPYWLAFREAGEELFRAYETLDLPADFESIWSTPRLLRMQSEYTKRHEDQKNSRRGALKVIQMYHRLKVLRLFDCDPITLKSKGDGGSSETLDHSLVIEGSRWHYFDLDGNHRLMSALYVGIDLVPVVLKSQSQ